MNLSLSGLAAYDSFTNICINWSNWMAGEPAIQLSCPGGPRLIHIIY